MNLYLVTCVKHGIFSDESTDVYVVSETMENARCDALELMKRLEYKYTDWVGNIELLASVNTHRAKHLLVVIQ